MPLRETRLRSRNGADADARTTADRRLLRCAGCGGHASWAPHDCACRVPIQQPDAMARLRDRSASMQRHTSTMCCSSTKPTEFDRLSAFNRSGASTGASPAGSHRTVILGRVDDGDFRHRSSSFDRIGAVAGQQQRSVTEQPRRALEVARHLRRSLFSTVTDAHLHFEQTRVASPCVRVGAFSERLLCVA